VIGVTEPPDRPPEPLLRTALYELHRAQGGHLVPFHGWELPLYYARTGILREHEAVRRDVGVFDVSHMGIITLEGPGGAALLSRRTPSNATRARPGQARYTCLLDPEAHLVDDALWMRTDEGSDPTNFLLVPNAGPAPRIFEVLRQHRGRNCEIERHNGAAGILAVQGPRSRELLESLFPWDLAGLAPYTGAFFPRKGPRSAGEHGGSFTSRLRDHALVSRTGYTGELGYELFLAAPVMPEVFQSLLRAGATPCGLGARDTLRMEKGYLLSGVDFHGDRTPLEAGLDRFLELDHPFVGREALERQRKAGGYPVWTGLLGEDPTAIPRHGMPLTLEGRPLAVVSSGGQSPTLRKGIALAYLPPEAREPGTSFGLTVRGRDATLQVVRLPFVRAR
jgi:aminomethyltransferase